MKYMKNIVRFILAGIVSLVLLTGFCFFYSRPPIHLPNKNQNTDYVWVPNFHWMLMSEGIAQGTTDADGYYNLHVIDNPNVLLLGSSHVEAQNVNQDQNMTSYLQKFLGSEYQVYNKGISGHFFAKVCQYLRANLEFYNTAPKYIIIETDSVSVSQTDVSNIMNHSVEFTPSYTEGLLAALQKNYFIRYNFHRLLNGWMDLLMDKPISSASTEADHSSSLLSNEQNPYDLLFSYIDELQQEFHTQIIIFYHPKEMLTEDGSAKFENPQELALFSDSCEKNNIIFMNMEKAFLELYTCEHKLPHGFITGAIGEGHLNEDGHRVIAQELSELILHLEEIS